MSPKVVIACNIMGMPMMLFITVAMQAGIMLAGSMLATTVGLMVAAVTTDAAKLTKLPRETSNCP